MDLVRINTKTIGGGGESIKYDPEPDAKAKPLSLLSPFSAYCLEGPDYFSRPFPQHHVTSVHSTSPEHELSNDINVDDVYGDDNDVDIRASIIWDVKRL